MEKNEPGVLWNTLSCSGCSAARPGTACTDVAPVPDDKGDDDHDDEDDEEVDEDYSPITASLLPWQLKSFGQEFVWKLKP